MNRKYVVCLKKEERAQVRAGSEPAPPGNRLFRHSTSPNNSPGLYLAPIRHQPRGPQLELSTNLRGVQRLRGDCHPRSQSLLSGRGEGDSLPEKSGREYSRRLDGEAEARLIALACSSPPEGHECWSLC